MLCMKSELDLFELPPIQTSVTSVDTVVYNPTTSLDNSSSIEFVIPGNGDTYKNLGSIYLRLLVELKTNEGAFKTETENEDKLKKIGVANNLLHSLFRQCTVSLNNVQVEQCNDYHYKAFFQTLLNYGCDSVKTHLSTTGWVLDEQNLDSLLPTENPKHGERNAWFQTSSGFNRKMELYGKLHVDFFNINKFLLNNVDLKLTLNREKSEFYMMERPENSSYINILEANLFIEHVHINPALLLVHNKMLEKTSAKYPFKRVAVRQYTLNAGTSSLSIDNVVLGRKPNMLLFSMLSNKRFVAARNLNPFYLEMFNLEQFVLYVDGKQVPSKPLVIKHSTEGDNISARAYNALFSQTGIRHFDKGHQITKQLFDSCYFMLAFDLTPDASYSSVCMNPITQCSIRIEGNFKTNLTEAVTCLIICEYDSMVEIDKLRNVALTI